MLALLGDQSAKQRAPTSNDGRSPSPYATSPRSPVRSMLDIGSDAPPPISSTNPSSPTLAKQTPPRIAPVRSMLDIDSPPAQPVRSMLDVGEPRGLPVKQVLSNPSSPVEPNFRSQRTSGHPRSLSDAASKPVSFGPRSSAAKIDPTLDYQFAGIITNHAGAALPKRVTLGGKKTANPSMMEVMRGNDVSGLTIPGDGRGRHYSIAGPSTNSKTTSKSKSPTSRLGMRSHSPTTSLINNRHLSPAGRAILQDSQTLDLNNAYRRLSDARLAISGGSLSELPTRKRSDDLVGSGRLAKSYLSPDGDLLPDDSSDDDASSSDEEGHRGRKAARAFDKAEAGSATSQSPESTRIPKSLLAAAEEERKCAAEKG